jgi:inositol transport system ATP-binding protein
LTEEYLLEMKNIIKEFPGVKALNDVTLKVRKGTVHALMGENGAGKSTLMKILNGIYHPDSGSVLFKGKEVKIRSPYDAISTGISMIHQELHPILDMKVAENIFLGREPTLGKSSWVSVKKMETEAKKLFDRLNIPIDPRSKMRELSISNMQMVEIAKAISYDCELIIMDEPTSAITEREVQNLFKIIHSLKEKGVSIIYITHKMDELFSIADEVTVLRDGEYIDTKSASEITKEELISMMVGRELKHVFPKNVVEIRDVFLSVRGLSKNGVFENISFNVRRGEIFGVAGLMGAGRTEVFESIFGITTPDSGEIIINGKRVEIKSPKDAIQNKISLVTEDRKASGLFLPMSVRDNIAFCSLHRYSIGQWIVDRKMNDCCSEYVKKLDIKTPGLGQIINFLSGGNQQKAILAKWLLTDPDIFILDEPTRGIDVGAKAEVHKLMSALAAEGKCIILISSELPEVLGMSDRIMVMHEGKVAGIVDRNELGDDAQEKILALASGS